MRSIHFLICAGAVHVLASTGFGQSRNDHWFLYRNVWIDFSSGAPQNLPSTLSRPGFRATLSDPSGVLLLHTDGDTLFNGAGQPVPGTNGLLATSGGGQGCLILPWPGEPTKAGVFCIRGSGTGGVAYSYFLEVELTMNGGAGGTSMQTPIHFMEAPSIPGGKMTGIPHANGVDHWVLTHARGTNAYHAYRFTATGLDMVPVISNAGAVHPLTARDGCVVASYDGNLLAMTAYAIGDTSRVELMSFDPASGVVASICALQGFQYAQGVEFSPSGGKLYVTDIVASQWSLKHELWQYDLASLDCGAILSSKTLIASDSTLSANMTPYKVLALGPDGKIYYRHLWKHPFLGVVNAPDEPGMACAYERDGYLTLNDTLLGIPNQCKRYHDSEMPWTTGMRSLPYPERAQVWPVPMHDRAWLRLSPGVVLDQLEWLDAWGRSMRTLSTAPVNGLTLDPQGLPSGTYVLKAYHKGALVAVGRAVIE